MVHGDLIIECAKYFANTFLNAPVGSIYKNLICKHLEAKIRNPS